MLEKPVPTYKSASSVDIDNVREFLEPKTMTEPADQGVWTPPFTDASWGTSSLTTVNTQPLLLADALQRINNPSTAADFWV